MTHKDAQKAGLWFGVVELCWIDSKKHYHERQFNTVAAARKHLAALVELGSVEQGSLAFISRIWRELVFEQTVPRSERID